MKSNPIKFKKRALLTLIVIWFFAFSNTTRAQNQENTSDQLQFAATLYRLGEISEGDGKLEQAQNLYESALKVRERELGPDHFLVGHTAAKLASIYGRRGNVVEATEFSTRARRILEKNLGPDHPIVVKLKQDLLILQMSGGERALPVPPAPVAMAPTTKLPLPAVPFTPQTLRVVVREGTISKEIEVNPVPRLHSRGFGEEPFGKNQPVPPRLHRRGFPWYGVKENEALPSGVILEKIDLPVEKGSVLLELKPKEKRVPFFNDLIDLPSEMMDSEANAKAWVAGTSSNDFCSVLNLKQVSSSVSEPWIKTMRNAAKALLDLESKRPVPVLYCAARTFSDVAQNEDVPYLKDSLNHSQYFSNRIEAARGLFRILGKNEFGTYRDTLKSAPIEARMAAAFVWVHEAEPLRDEEIISLAKETFATIKNDNSILRIKTAELLFKLPSEKSMELLEEALNDQNHAVQMRALQILFLKNPEANIGRLAVHLLSQNKESYEYIRSLQILAGAASNLKALYDALTRAYLVKMKIIGLMRKEFLNANDDLTSVRTLVWLSDIFTKPNKQQITSTVGLTAIAIWEQGGVGPVKSLYRNLEHLEGRYHDWDFAYFLARLRIGLLMDFFEERWNQLIKEPDKEPWTLLLYHEALGRALQAPFEKDRKRAEGIVTKGLESNDPWLQLLAARASLLAQVEMESDRKKPAQEFLFYFHDKKDFDEWGDFALGRLTLAPTLKQTEQGLEIQLNQIVVWDYQGVSFGAGTLLENTKTAVGKNGEALIQSIVLSSPKGEEFSPIAPLKEGTVLFSVKEDPLKQPGWLLRIKCVYKTLGQEPQERTFEFPLE